MVEDQQPPIVFKDKDVRCVGLCAAHLVAVCSGDAFEARDPGGRALDFDGYFRNVDTHKSGVAKDLLPARADILPSRQSRPVRMNADGTCIGGPHLVHEIEIEAFQSEVELEVSFDDVFRIGHKQ